MHGLALERTLACVMVWAYFSFSQFLIIWAGNLPKEIPWYLERLKGGWQFVALILVLGHFALPFALLLSRDLKRNFKLLATRAIRMRKAGNLRRRNLRVLRAQRRSLTHQA